MRPSVFALVETYVPTCRMMWLEALVFPFPPGVRLVLAFDNLEQCQAVPLNAVQNLTHELSQKLQDELPEFLDREAALAGGEIGVLVELRYR